MQRETPFRPRYGRLPVYLQGVSGVLLIVFFGLFISFNGFHVGALTSVDFVIGLLTSGPFLGLIWYGGWWLGRSELSETRYPRVTRWTVGGCLGFLGLNLVMIASWPASGVYNNLAWAEFAGIFGCAVGLGFGLFEARAIDREVVAERERVKQAEMARQNEQLEEFANVVSHDLRNPLNVATGRLELAKADCGSEHLDAVERSLSRMDVLIEDVLLLARTGAGIDDLEPVALGPLVERCWLNVVTHDAALTVNVDREIMADRSRVQQLLENLIRNAIEHAGSDVTVTVGELSGGFYVSDDGPGIPEAERDEVFQTGYSMTEAGTGFGLTIVEQIADAHGWDIRVTESESSGARFEITDVDRPPHSE